MSRSRTLPFLTGQFRAARPPFASMNMNAQKVFRLKRRFTPLFVHVCNVFCSEECEGQASNGRGMGIKTKVSRRSSLKAGRLMCTSEAVRSARTDVPRGGVQLKECAGVVHKQGRCGRCICWLSRGGLQTADQQAQAVAPSGGTNIARSHPQLPAVAVLLHWKGDTWAYPSAA